MVPLIRLGNGHKLHIPHRDRPLCEVGRYNLENKPSGDYVQAEKVTCQNCIAVAQKIAAYV